MSTRGDQIDATSTCIRKVKKYSQNDRNGLSAWILLLCCYCCYETNDDLGMLPSLEKAKTLGSCSTQETQKNPENFLECPQTNLRLSCWETTMLLLLLEIK